MSVLIGDYALRVEVHCTDCRWRGQVELRGSWPPSVRKTYESADHYSACPCGASHRAKYGACVTTDQLRAPAFVTKPVELEGVTGEAINDVLVKQVATLEHELRALRALLAEDKSPWEKKEST